MSIKSIAATTTLIVALFSQASFAVLPPLSQAQREATATHIVTGYVMGIKKEIKEATYGSDAVYTVTLMILGVKKGSEIKNDETIQFNYWKTDDRPRGWCGNGGQSETVKQYTDIQVYLEQDETTGKYSLLTPNGFDLVNL